MIACWSYSSRETIYILLNVKAAKDLAIQRNRTVTAMVLTYFSRNVPVSAPEWFIDLYIWTIYGVVIYVVWKALSGEES